MLRLELIETARRVPLLPEVQRRGVQLFRRRDVHWACCPFHKERTPSFKVSRNLFYCFACNAGGDVITFVMKADGVSFAQAVQILAGDARLSIVAPVAPSTDESPSESKEKCTAKARAIWTRSRPITDTPAERYLRERRGYLGPLPATLGFLPGWRDYPPCMIAAFGICDEREPRLLHLPVVRVRGVQRTLLKPDGSDKADVKPNKLSRGACKGSPIVLAPVNDLLGLAVTEGIEDGLSVFAATRLGVWAAGGAPFMPALADVVPRYVESIAIYAHPGHAGQCNAHDLAQRLTQRGNIEVAVVNLEGADR